ncbi:MAG: hypothetical protein FD141_346 [Fusobacteria bacterium]|nr:MAG: hypothetical protein FD141_346 [Fusobacteriota bacterium]KAF0228989.1 MAG: hypothetical protein FD182_1245 [Fusobacteriota bacterium]
MKISELFYMYQGNGLELINMTISNVSPINFISRTAQNNGVVAKVESYENIKPFESGLITVALGGSVLSSFVQNKPFYTAFHIMVLKPKIEMTINEKLYYCMCIQSNAYRYNYGRQANKSLKDIDLPSIIPTWINTYSIKPVSTTNTFTKNDLDTSSWKDFNLTDLFNLERGSRLTKENRLVGDIPLVTAGYLNEGIAEMIFTEENKIYSNKITIDMFGNAFYRNYNFYCDDNIIVLINKFNANKYILLFIVTIINADIYRYSYGRQYRQKDAKNQVIKLPIDDCGFPDWDFMESYIVNLPYSDRI